MGNNVKTRITLNGGSEIMSDTARVSGKEVLGCKIHKRDIMISFYDEEKRFHDVFLNQKTAEFLYEELGKRIQENKNYDK